MLIKLTSLQTRMESLKERIALMKELENVKAKMPWVEYNEHIDKVEEVRICMIKNAFDT